MSKPNVIFDLDGIENFIFMVFSAENLCVIAVNPIVTVRGDIDVHYVQIFGYGALRIRCASDKGKYG